MLDILSSSHVLERLGMVVPFRVDLSALFLAALVCGCGERFGDPIVALETLGPTGAGGREGSGDQGNAVGAAWPSLDGGASAGGSGGGLLPSAGVVGLCVECTESEACGDENDLCVRNDATGRQFCARDCSERGGCPPGYACGDVQNSALDQCLPIAGECQPTSIGPPELDSLRDYVLGRLNAARVERNRPTLDNSFCLDDLAQASALEFARTDQPLAKFERECRPLHPDCECGWQAQAEATIASYGLEWPVAVDDALASQIENGEPLLHVFEDEALEDVGIGFYISGDEAWLALSFR
jgi:hypothetical protein